MSERLYVIGPSAIIRPADAQLLELDARVDRAEDDGIRARWEFGRELLRERVGHKLPSGRLDELAARTGKSRTEIKYRVLFADRFPDEAALVNAVDQYGSWHVIVNEAIARARSESASEPVAPPTGTFATIVADPPWPYDNKATRGAAEDHYHTMSIEELCAVPVASWTGEHAAHLYLWTTNGFLREAFDVVDAWGFVYKTTLVWAKPQIGMGNYFRSSTEYVLFGVRGSLRTRDRSLANWFQAPRTRHSQKPGLFFDLVEKASYPPYLEMFARRRRLDPRWDYWGDEA